MVSVARTVCPQHEIVAPGPLLSPEGRLVEPGFARRPLLLYDPARVRLTPFRCLDRLRLKEWDFYATTTRELGFAVAVANGGLAGVVFAEVLDFRARTVRERLVVTPLGRGCALPRTSEAGDVRFRGRGGVEVDLLVRGGGRRREIRVSWPRFDGSDGLDARLVATEPPSHESIVMATPIGARGFYYNRKTCCLPTEGTNALGGATATAPIALDGGRALTTIDWGRGVWPYRTFWIWATGSGRLRDGRTFGLNLGGGFGDTSAATENCVFVDGRMTKLAEVDLDHDRDDPCRRAWRFRAPDGRLDLELAPVLLTRRKRLNALVIASDFHQVQGTFRGHADTDAGERIELADEVVGWAERHRARW